MQSESADIKYEVRLILININMYYININLFKLHRESNWEYLYKIEANEVTLSFSTSQYQWKKILFITK